MTVSKNNLDVTLTAEARATVTTNLETLGDSMTFLASVLPGDGRRLVKLGDKSEGFVRQAHQIVRDYGEVLPLGLSLEQMDRDVAMREFLLPLQQRLTQMLRLVNDTYMLAGSDLMQASMIVYRCLKSHGSAVGLTDLTHTLGRRFQGQGKQAVAPEPAADGGTTPAPEPGA